MGDNGSDGLNPGKTVLERINNRKNTKNIVKLTKIKGRKEQSVPRTRRTKNSFNQGHQTSLTRLPATISNRGEMPAMRSVIPYRASKGYLDIYTANIVDMNRFKKMEKPLYNKV